MVVRGRFVFRRSSSVAAAIAWTIERLVHDEPAEPQ